MSCGVPRWPLQVYKDMTKEAKELSNLTQPGQQPASALQALWAAVKRFVPLPFFK
jgi:hypothetical protein